jgi:hypothetical protein
LLGIEPQFLGLLARPIQYSDYAVQVPQNKRYLSFKYGDRNGLNKVIFSKKGKAFPLQAWGGPEGSRKLRFPHYVTTTQYGGKVVSLTYRPPLTPGNAPGADFCKKLNRPQGHSAIGRIMSMKNSSDTIWNRTSDLQICSTVP